jgi:hypothetical protein
MELLMLPGLGFPPYPSIVQLLPAIGGTVLFGFGCVVALALFISHLNDTRHDMQRALRDLSDALQEAMKWNT